MFDPTSTDEVSVQVIHLEARGKNVNPEVGGSSKPTTSKSKEKRKQKWKERKANVVQKTKPSCTHCNKDGHEDEHCWILHPELKPKNYDGKKKKTIAAIQKDLGSDSGDETTITAASINGKNYEHLLVILHKLLIVNKMREEDMSFFILELFPTIKRLILYLIVVHK